jgi:hypothetical protein
MYITCRPRRRLAAWRRHPGDDIVKRPEADDNTTTDNPVIDFSDAFDLEPEPGAFDLEPEPGNLSASPPPMQSQTRAHPHHHHHHYLAAPHKSAAVTTVTALTRPDQNATAV